MEQTGGHENTEPTTKESPEHPSSPGGTLNKMLDSSHMNTFITPSEDASLSYAQAKRLRQQVEKDVELLRNRVRMLQQEETKAVKKISETHRKTQQIMQLKAQNDERFNKQMQEQRMSLGSMQVQQMSTYNRRQKQQQDLTQRKARLAEDKYREAQAVRRLMSEQRAFK